MKTLYVSDLDGTLITSRECISPYSIGVLNRLISKGMNFTYATARSVKTALSATTGLNDNYPIIVYNGALIVNPSTREILHSVTFDGELKQYVLSVLISLGVYPFTYYMYDGMERIGYLSGKESYAMDRYLSRRQNDDRLSPVYKEEELAVGDLFYFNCMGEASLMYRAYEIFSRDSRLTCLIHRETYQTDYWLEIMCKNATKAEGVKRLKELYSYDKVICFGDSINDIPMFAVSDEKYAVMNADEELKSVSTSVIGYCEEDGVAKWLEKNSGF